MFANVLLIFKILLWIHKEKGLKKFLKKFFLQVYLTSKIKKEFKLRENE
jgi:hypothetical protein